MDWDDAADDRNESNWERALAQNERDGYNQACLSTQKRDRKRFCSGYHPEISMLDIR